MIRSDEILLKRRPLNFAEVVRQRELGIPDYVTNGDFLDAFYRAADSDRQSFLDTEPPQSNTIDLSPSTLALFAATAEKLANDYGLRVPKWTQKRKYFKAEPRILGKPLSAVSTEFVTVLRNESPSEFIKRNLYVSGNVLSRM